MNNDINIIEKECTKCKKVKSINEFGRGKSYKNGIHCWCKLCMNENAKLYYQNNKEKHREYMIQYQKNNKIKIRQYQKEYYNTPDKKTKQSEYAKKWRDIPENKKRRRAQKLAWDRKAMLNPTHRISNNMRGGMYHALKGKKGFKKWESLIGYSLQDLINHIEPLLLNTPMTWDNYGSYWHIDHITPKSWFKYTDEHDPKFKECWSLSNLQPKEKIANIKKGNRFIG